VDGAGASQAPLLISFVYYSCEDRYPEKGRGKLVSNFNKKKNIYIKLIIDNSHLKSPHQHCHFLAAKT
jgi:hypothetical protein